MPNIPDTSSIRNIRYLTCQGGGMKGIGYVGAVAELEAQGILAQIEEVAGSSAGGLFATLLAIGCTKEEIEQEFGGIDFRSFQDKSEPGWVESGISKHAKVVDDVVKLAFSSDLGIWEGDTLSYWLGSIIARKTGNPNITFRELDELTKIPGSQFKKLTLTGANVTDKQIEYYNASLTPDLPIVKAARISASFPFGFKPVTSVDQSGREILKVDGGLLENLPNVFNKEPYVSADGLNKYGGNPKAFALAFKGESSEDQSIPANIVKFGAAVVKAKLSDKNEQKKYGANIALINTVGMGTLEFEATQEKRNALVDSGKQAIVDAVNEILKQEKEIQPDYKTMSAEELIRKEIAIIGMEKNETDDKRKRQLQEQLVPIRKALKQLQDTGKISKDHMDLLRNKEHKRLSIIEKRKDNANLTDQELLAICEHRIRELQTINQQLIDKVQTIETAKSALQVYQEDIIYKFEQDSGFRDKINALNEIEEKISENLEKKSNLQENNTLNDETKNAQHAIIDKEYEKLKSEKDKHLQLFMKTDDALSKSFFTNLFENRNAIDFFVPNTLDKLEKHFSLEIDACEQQLEGSKKILDQSQKELTSFLEQHKQNFATRKDTAINFSELFEFKKTLDQAINKKTTPLVKLNNFLIQKMPKLKRIITPFLQGAAYLSFIAWLPVAAPVVGVAKAVEHFSKKQKTKTAANNMINFFSCTDLQLNTKLRHFRDLTGRILRSNKSNEYLPKLYEHYFNGSNVKLDEFVKEIQQAIPNTVVASKKPVITTAQQKSIDPPQDLNKLSIKTQTTKSKKIKLDPTKKNPNE